MWWNKILILQCCAICVLQMIASVDSQAFVSPDELFASMKNNDRSHNTENLSSDHFKPLQSTTGPAGNSASNIRPIPTAVDAASGDKITANEQIFEEKSVTKAKNNTGDGTDTGFKTGATRESKHVSSYFYRESNSEDPNNGTIREFKSFQPQNPQGYGGSSPYMPYRPPGFNVGTTNRNFPGTSNDIPTGFGVTNNRHSVPFDDPLYNPPISPNNINPPSWVQDLRNRLLQNRPPFSHADNSDQPWPPSRTNFRVPFETEFSSNTNTDGLRLPLNPINRNPNFRVPFETEFSSNTNTDGLRLPLNPINRNPLDHFPTGFRTENNFFENNFANGEPLHGFGATMGSNTGFRTTSYTDGNGHTVERTVSW